MKNADEMLKRIMGEVDQDRDGKIQYEGMHAFSEATDSRRALPDDAREAELPLHVDAYQFIAYRVPHIRRKSRATTFCSI